MNPLLYEYISPSAVIHLERNPYNDSIYRVIKKEHDKVSNLFGKLPSESCFAGEEFLILRFEWQDLEKKWEYLLFSTHPDALGKAEINPFYQGEGPTRVARFTLSPTREACIVYDTFRVMLNFSENLERLCLRFFEGIERYSDKPLYFYDLGLAEIRVG